MPRGSSGRVSSVPGGLYVLVNAGPLSCRGKKLAYDKPEFPNERAVIWEMRGDYFGGGQAFSRCG